MTRRGGRRRFPLSGAAKRRYSRPMQNGGGIGKTALKSVSVTIRAQQYGRGQVYVLKCNQHELGRVQCIWHWQLVSCFEDRNRCRCTRSKTRHWWVSWVVMKQHFWNLVLMLMICFRFGLLSLGLGFCQSNSSVKWKDLVVETIPDLKTPGGPPDPSSGLAEPTHNINMSLVPEMQKQFLRDLSIH